MKSHYFIDSLESAVCAVNQKLFLFSNREGIRVFQFYDASTGYPNTGELVVIPRKGYGFCKMLDGGSIPREGIHVLENGWGCAVLSYSFDCSESAIVQKAKSLAIDLASNFSEPVGALELASAKVTSIVNSIRRKIAAFRAA